MGQSARVGIAAGSVLQWDQLIERPAL